MRNKRALLTGLALGGVMVLGGSEAGASSHREAPFITQNPKVDNTDFYIFNSYETGRDDYVTILANFIPLQSNYGGPNFFTMDPEALYEIHIDNDGDAKEDITFQFRFFNRLNDATGNTGLTLALGGAPVSVPLYNIGGLTDASNQDARNVKEEYELKILRGPRRAPTKTDPIVPAATLPAGSPVPSVATRFVKPADFIGTKSFGTTTNYDTYAGKHSYSVDIPGCAGTATKKARLFVGQRAEGFAVNLGPIFDLVNAPLSVLADPSLNAPNPIGGANVTTLALEIPKECLTKDAMSPTIGAWSTASVRQARALNPAASFTKPSREGGAWVQVSRLGSPLVNEVVIGLKDKNKFNNSEPKDDVANFGPYILTPTLPKLLEILFGPTAVNPTGSRADLLAIFATGLDKVNQIKPMPAAGEMLRLNTALPATSSADQMTRRKAGEVAQMGALYCFVNAANPTTDGKVLNTAATNCDPAGFPNGRRPGDDVVDIALRAVMGYVLSQQSAPNTDVPLGDAVPQHAGQFDAVFPYLKPPHPGS